MSEYEHHDVDDDDFLDGCDLPFDENPVDDGDLDGVILFADVDTDDPEAVEARILEWRRLFGGDADA